MLTWCRRRKSFKERVAGIRVVYHPEPEAVVYAIVGDREETAALPGKVNILMAEKRHTLPLSSRDRACD